MAYTYIMSDVPTAKLGPNGERITVPAVVAVPTSQPANYVCAVCKQTIPCPDHVVRGACPDCMPELKRISELYYKK